jgi:ATP-dependent Clp protease ATP-binding subunit ClpC
MIKRETKLGFAVKSDEAKAAEQQFSEVKEKLLGQLKRLFRPEFLNRVDATIVFRPLTKEQIGLIVTLELNKVQKRLSEHNIIIQTTDEAKAYLGEKGYDPDYGARPLRRVIQNEVEDVLSDGLLSGRFQDNNAVRIGLSEGKLTFETAGEIVGNSGVEIKPIELKEPDKEDMLFAAN